MGDLELFGKKFQQLQGLLTILKQFSDNIRVQFGLNKCAKATFFKGEITETSNNYRVQQNGIKGLEPVGSY